MLPLAGFLVGYLSAILQIGVLALDLLLVLLVRRSLRHPLWDAWAGALAGYAAAIAILVAGSILVNRPGAYRAPSIAISMVVETVAVAAFVAGARRLSGQAPWTGPLIALIGIFAASAVLTEILHPPFMVRYAVHASGLALFFGLAAVFAWRGRRVVAGVGITLVAVTFALLAVDDGQYFVLLALHVPLAETYLALDTYVTILLNIALGAGMIVISTDRSQQRLLEIALTDPLSGLRNRSAFSTVLRKPPAAGAVAMIDLDRLKHINDTYGHRSGDRAIAALGEALARLVNDPNRAFRIGGDEFALIVPGIEPEELDADLEHVKSGLAVAPDPERGGTDPLSISWGVSRFSAAVPIERAIAQADDLLYTRKPARAQ